MRKIKRNQLKGGLLRNHSGSKFLPIALSVALSLGVTASSYADGIVSNNLPVPNYVNGASFSYNNGALTINNNAGAIGTAVQNQVVGVAGTNGTVLIDLGNSTNQLADLKYDSYNVGQKNTVTYQFGGANQVALNRVTRANPSSILGKINEIGSGTVFLINPNGILFGGKSTVNVGSFIASTLNLTGTPTDLSSVTLERASGSPAASIVFERGSKINTTNSATFLSNTIINNSKAINSGGNIQLITGDRATIELANNSVKLVNPDSVVKLYNDNGKTGDVAKGSINVGAGSRLAAQDINVIAKAYNNNQNSIVNMDGVIVSNAVITGDKGSITIYAENLSPNKNANVRVATATTDGIFDVSADGNVDLTNNVTADSHITVVSGGNVSASKNLQSNNGAIIIDSLGTLDTQQLQAANNIQLIGDKIATTKVTSGDSVVLLANGKVQVTQDLKAADKVDIVSKNNSIIARKITTDNNYVSLVADKTIDTRTINAKGGSVYLEGNKVTTTKQSNRDNDILADGDIIIASASTVSVDALTSTQGKVQIDAETKVNTGNIETKYNGSNANKGDVLISSNKGPVITKKITTQSGDVSVETVTKGAFTATQIATKSGNVTGVIQDQITTGKITSDSGNIQLVSVNKGIKTTDTVKTGGFVDLVAENGEINTKAVQSTGSTVNMTAKSITTVKQGNGKNNVTALDDVTLLASNNIATNDVISSDGNISLYAGKNISANNLTAQYDGADETKGNVAVQSEAGNVKLNNTSTQTGDVLVAADAGAVTVNQITSGTGNISLDADKQITTGKMNTIEGRIIATSENKGVKTTDTVKAGKSVILTAMNGQVNTKAVESTGKHVLLAGKSVTTVAQGNGKNNLKAQKSVIVAGTDSVALNDVTSTEGNILIGSTGNVVANNLTTNYDGPAFLKGNVVVGSLDRNVNVNNITTKSGNVVALAGGNVTTNAVSSDTGSFLAFAEGNITTGKVVMTEGNVFEVSTDGNIKATDTIKAGNDVTLIAENGQVNTRSITAGDDVEIAAKSVTTVAQGNKNQNNVVAGDDVNIEAETTVALNNVTSTAGKIEIDAGGNILANNLETQYDSRGHSPRGFGGHHSRDNGNVDITSSNGNITLNNVTTVKGDIDILAKEGAVKTNALASAKGDISVDGEKQVTIASAIANRGDVDIESDSAGIKVTGALRAGDDVTLQAENGQVNTRSITAGDDVEIAAKSVTTVAQGNKNQNNVVAGDDVNIEAETTVALNNVTSTAGKIEIDAGGNILANNLETQYDSRGHSPRGFGGHHSRDNGNVDITSSNGNITLNNVTTVKGDIDILAKEGAVKTNALASAKGDISVDGEKQVTIASAIANRGDVDIESDSAGIKVTGTLRAGDDVTLQAENGQVNTKAITAGDDVEIAAKSVTTVAQGNKNQNNVVAGDDVNIEAETTVALNNVTSQTGDISLLAGGNIKTNNVETQLEAPTSNDNGNIEILSGSGSINTNNVTADNGNIEIATEGGNVTTKAVTSAQGDIDILANKQVTTAQVVATEGEVSIESDTKGIKATGNIRAGDDINLYANNGQVNTKQLTAGDDIRVRATSLTTVAQGNPAQNNILAQDQIQIETRGSVNVNDVTSEAGYISIYSGEQVKTNNLTTNYEGPQGPVRLSLPNGTDLFDGDISVVSENNAITTNNIVANAGSVTLKADGQVNVNQVTTNDGTANASSYSKGIKATGRIKAGGTITLSAQNGEVNTKNLVSTGDSVVVDAKSFTTNKQGNNDISAFFDVLITAANSVNVNNVTAQQGNIEVEAGGNVNTNNLETTHDNPADDAGLISVHSTGGNITTNKVTTKSGDINLVADIGKVVTGVISSLTGDVFIFGGNQVTTSKITSTDGSVTVESENKGIKSTGTIKAGGPIELTAHNGEINVQQVESTGSTIDIDGNSVTTVKQGLFDVIAESDITINGNTTVSLDDVISRNGHIIITAGGRVLTNDLTASNGKVDVSSENSSLNLGDILALNQIVLNAPKSITTGDLQSLESFVLATSDGKILTGDIDAQTYVDLLSVNGGIETGAINAVEGFINLEGLGGSVVTNGDLNAEMFVSINADKNVNTNGNSINAGSFVNVTAGNAILGGDITSRDNYITLVANKNVEVDALSAARDINITSGAGIISVGSAETDRSIFMNSWGNIFTGDLLAGNIINLDTDHSIRINGLTKARNAFLTAFTHILAGDFDIADNLVFTWHNGNLVTGTISPSANVEYFNTRIPIRPTATSVDALMEGFESVDTGNFTTVLDINSDLFYSAREFSPILPQLNLTVNGAAADEDDEEGETDPDL